MPGIYESAVAYSYYISRYNEALIAGTIPESLQPYPSEQFLDPDKRSSGLSALIETARGAETFEADVEAIRAAVQDQPGRLRGLLTAYEKAVGSMEDLSEEPIPTLLECVSAYAGMGLDSAIDSEGRMRRPIPDAVVAALASHSFVRDDAESDLVAATFTRLPVPLVTPIVASHARESDYHAHSFAVMDGDGLSVCVVDGSFESADGEGVLHEIHWDEHDIEVFADGEGCMSASLEGAPEEIASDLPRISKMIEALMETAAAALERGGLFD